MRATLTYYLREALEQWTKESLSGPWDDLIDEIGEAILDSQLSLTRAARIDYLLRATAGTDVLPPVQCDVCECPMPGMSHVGGERDQGDAVIGGCHG